MLDFDWPQCGPQQWYMWIVEDEAGCGFRPHGLCWMSWFSSSVFWCGLQPFWLQFQHVWWSELHGDHRQFLDVFVAD